MATALLRAAADRGHAESQSHLSYCYYTGDGVEQNELLAAEWARRAAEQGHAPAQAAMAGRCRLTPG